jgi:hypothetical protein
MDPKKLKQLPHFAKLTKKTCPMCTNEFTAHRSDAVYCSAACRQQHYLLNKQQQKEKLAMENIPQLNEFRDSAKRLEDCVKYMKEKDSPEVKQGSDKEKQPIEDNTRRWDKLGVRPLKL